MKEIVFRDDKYRMNWLRTDYEYGKVRCPKELEYRITNRMEGECIHTEITLTNTGTKPLFSHVGEIGIAFPLEDKYEDSRTCIERKCHTHIFCGEEVSYIMALRMGGEAPHLGMVLTEGSISDYSVERDLSRQSNDRGCFWLNLSSMEFDARETKRICWTIFPHQGKDDFQRKLGLLSKYIKVEADRYVLFAGERTSIRITPSFETYCVTVDGKEIQTVNGEYIVEYAAQEKGEKTFQICADGIHTWCRIFVHETLEVLAENRCRFIAERQQYHGRIHQLENAYLAYDNEEGTHVYTPENDFNGGRERVGMGVLMSRYLQWKTQERVVAQIKEKRGEEEKKKGVGNEKDKELEQSLLGYLEFVKRELVDIETGIVCNDIGMDDGFKRLYNLPWFTTFFIELFQQYEDQKYLLYAARIVRVFYEKGGINFYPIDLPTVMMDQALMKAGMMEEEQELKKWFVRHADTIMEKDINYPASEVNYEQSIVAPAADVLLQVYMITKEEKYLRAGEKQIKVLELFNGIQPDYHLYEIAIRHWDGYWFGKKRMYGDTFPHYWSALTGNVFELYAQITGDSDYANRSENSRRGVLPLIFPDGSASCAYVYPHSVNGTEGAFYDPYANDQDWGLYFYLRSGRH